jgi:hypothetical protein
VKIIVGMNVVTGQRTTTKTLATWGLSNMVVWSIFPSKGFTHGQMWWKSFFTIKLTLEPMEILFKVHVTQGQHHGCQHMFHTCLTSWNFYMDPIKVRLHCETNLWQAQIDLVGMSECRWTNDLGWFPMTPRYCLLGLEAQ